MKKIFATILSMAILISASTTAFAYDEGTYSGSGESQITAYAYSTYSVTIPATINLTNGQGDVSVSNADIDTGYEIEVVVTNLNENGHLDMTHNTKDGVTSECILMNANGRSVGTEEPILATIKDTDISKGSAYTYFLGQMIDGASAGSYTGTMRYALYCSRY